MAETMSMRWRAVRAAALAVILGGPAAAAGPLDLLFNTPHMRDVPAGSTLVYDHVRASNPALGLGEDFDSSIRIVMGEGAAAQFTMDADGPAPRTFDVNAGVPGNPLLMVFLENAVRSVAKATGGSEFYLRNRMKEALRDGLREEDGAFVMRPFAQDAQRARMGALADMALRFEVSETSPGMLVALRAEAGPQDNPVYREEIRYDAAQ
jgi:hypothetical protein